MSDIILSEKEIKSKRIAYLAFGTITLLVLGLIYAWSIFARPLQAAFQWDPTQLSLVFQISMVAFTLSALGGAQLIKKTSAKLAIIASAVLLAAGFVLTALFASMGIWSLYVFYGVLAGAGCGIGYNAIISLVSPWFPDAVGLCSGVLMMGFGLGSLVLGTLANQMISSLTWAPVFMIIAVTGAVVLVACALLVKPAPKNISDLAPQAAAAASKLDEDQNMLKTPVFYFYSIWATAVIACGMTLIGSASQGAVAVGVDEGFAVLLVGLVSTMNGVARVVNGFIFDRLGLVFVMLLGAVVAIACSAGLSFSFITQSPTAYIVAGISIAFAYGGVPVMASAFARQRFGAKNFAKNLGITNLNIATGAFLSSAVVAIARSVSGDAAVYGVLAVLGIVSVVGAVAFSGAYKRDLKKIQEG